MNRFIIIKTVEDDYHYGLLNQRFNKISINDKRVKFNKTCIPLNRISWIKSDLLLNEYKAICKDLGVTGNKNYIKSLLDYNKSIGSNPRVIKIIAYLQDINY